LSKKLGVAVKIENETLFHRDNNKHLWNLEHDKKLIRIWNGLAGLYKMDTASINLACVVSIKACVPTKEKKLEEVVIKIKYCARKGYVVFVASV